MSSTTTSTNLFATASTFASQTAGFIILVLGMAGLAAIGYGVYKHFDSHHDQGQHGTLAVLIAVALVWVVVVLSAFSAVTTLGDEKDPASPKHQPTPLQGFD